MSKRPTLIERLTRFEAALHPLNRREFVALLQEVKDHPTFDHADWDLQEWLDSAQARQETQV